MDPVETSCLDEARKSIRAAFTSTRRSPSFPNATRISAGEICPSGAGKLWFRLPALEKRKFQHLPLLFDFPGCTTVRCVGAVPRIHHDAYRIGATNAAHGQSRIVSTCSLDPNDDGINQGSQPMKMFERGGAIDVMRAAGSGCHSAVERLADLASNHEIVDLSLAQGSKNLFPPRWQRRNKRAK